MDAGTRRTIYSNLYKANAAARGDDIHKRGLITLLRANEEIARERSLYQTDEERIRAMFMTWPIASKKAFAIFGLIYGSFPLLTVVLRVMRDAYASSDAGMFVVASIVVAVATGGTGYALGRIVPDMVRKIAHFRQPNRFALIVLIGFLWGATAGAAGGVFIFIIGAIFGAILGGIAGAVAVPLLVISHSALRAGDVIELKHFLPIAFGITLTLCAFILGV